MTLLAHYQRRFWKEAGKRERERKEEDIPKQGISKVEAKAGTGRPPPPPGAAACRPHRQEPGTHWLPGLEPAPLREGPAGQDDAGQGHRLPLQHPDGGGAAGDLWGRCGERRQCGSRCTPVGSHLGDPVEASGMGTPKGSRGTRPRKWASRCSSRRTWPRTRRSRRTGGPMGVGGASPGCPASPPPPPL